MIHYVDRVIAWNAARYPQQSNTNLTMALLVEEVQELCEASHEVEGLDAVGDILFVAIGALWKVGCSSEAIKQVLDDLFAASPSPALMVSKTLECSHILANSGSLVICGTKDDAMLINTIMAIITLMIIPLLVQEGRYKYAVNIIEAICTSNETKQIPSEQVDPSIKANSGASGKGPNYVSPTKDLEKIVDLPRVFRDGSVQTN